MNPRLANSIRLLAVAGGALASVATSEVEGGDRTGPDGTPTCPADETCSDQTPTGLYFGGARTGDSNLFGSWPQATAVGGVQTIRVYTDPDAARPFALPFDATTAGEAVAVVGQSANRVTVRGDADGVGQLRLTEPDSDLLYDRVDLRAGQVGSVVLVGAGTHRGADVDLFFDPPPVAMMAGGQARIAVALFDDEGVDGSRLIDESMVISGDETAADPEGYFDTVLASPAAPGILELSVASAGRTWSANLPVHDRATAIDQSAGRVELRRDEPSLQCFRGLVGSEVLLGASARFESTARLRLEQAPDDIFSHCVSVIGTSAGTATLTVTIAGFSRDYIYEITSESRRSAATASESSLRIAGQVEMYLAGDRAENRWFASAAARHRP